MYKFVLVSNSAIQLKNDHMLSSVLKLEIERYYIECPDFYSFEDSYALVMRKLIEFNNELFDDSPTFRNEVFNYMDEIQELV